METKSWRMYGPNLICIGIDKYDRNEYSGRIWHQYADDPIPYLGTMDLIQIMDRLYDEWKFPERSTSNRSFEKTDRTAGSQVKKGVEVKMDANRIQNKSGDKGTFIVHVKYRQNSTWQGDVVWAEKSKKQSFRSALELLKMIDEALDTPVEMTDTDNEIEDEE